MQSSEKASRRIAAAVQLTFVGAGVGALTGIPSHDVVRHAIIGALILLALSFVDVLFALIGGSMALLVFVGAPIMFVLAAAIGIHENPGGWVTIFKFVGPIATVIGLLIGASAAEKKLSAGAKGALIGVFGGVVLTTIFVGCGVMLGNSEAGPHPHPLENHEIP